MTPSTRFRQGAVVSPRPETGFDPDIGQTGSRPAVISGFDLGRETPKTALRARQET